MSCKFRLLSFALCGACSLFSALATAAENDARSDDTDRHLAVLLNYANLDSDRNTDGRGLGATFVYGHEIRNNWLLEARLTGLVLESGDVGGTDFYQQDVGVDAVYRFPSRSGWRPFAFAGLSIIRNDVAPSELDDVGAGAHVGAGISSPPLGGMNLRIRTELRYVHDSYVDGQQDVRLGIGIQIPLGRDPSIVTAPALANAQRGGRGDRDSDGVSDGLDRCPSSLPYVEHDESGCMLPNQVIRMYEVTFDNGTAILTSAAREELSQLVRALRGQPDLPVRIDGHSDSYGSPAANRQLSLERAEAVATYLVLQGVPTQRLSVKGHGSSKPVESNSTAAGREKNRRIEIVLLEPEEH